MENLRQNLGAAAARCLRRRERLDSWTSTPLVVSLLAISACDIQPSEGGWHPPPDSVQGLRYEVTGAGPAVVMIHGAGLDSRMWRPQIHALTSRFRVIRYDVRGFGQSKVEARDHAHADDLMALLDHLEVPSASLVGLSLGGAIALDFALRHPERTERLLLAAPAVPGAQMTPEEPERFMRIARLAEEGRTREAATAWLGSRHMANAMTIPRVATLVGTMARDNHVAWLPNPSPEPLLDPAIADRLPAIRVQTSVIVGTRDDRSVLEVARLVRDAVPGASLQFLPGTGHVPNLEAPTAFNRWLLSQLPDSTASARQPPGEANTADG